MNIDEIQWRHPCGCGDTAHRRAEFAYSGGWLRVREHDDGAYLVDKFGHDKQRDGAAIVMTADELAALIS